MATTEFYKNQIQNKKKLVTLQELFGSNQNSSFGGYFFKAMEDMVQKITESAINDLLSNTKMVEAIATIASRKIPPPKNGANGIQGIPGRKGEDGKTPVKGRDYFTEDEVKEIAELARPRRGKDYLTNSEMEIIKSALKPIAGIDYPVPTNGKDGTEIEGKDIVQKINDLEITLDKQIDAKHIKNLPKMDSGKGVGLSRGGLKLRFGVELDGVINSVNTVFTVPAAQPTPKDGKYVISVRGVLKNADSGDFTVSNNNRTVTFTQAPPTDSARPRIEVYEAH